jgi:Fic family protein
MLDESTSRIEPTRLETIPVAISDLVAELAAATATLESSLHPRTAANLAGLVRIMNTYYSNLIEGHNTRPRDIVRALDGHLDANVERRNLQIEAASHVRAQSLIDELALTGTLPDPVSSSFIRKLHAAFYEGASPEMLRVEGAGRSFVMQPGAWRSLPEHDVAVGRHVPPASGRVEAFMEYFQEAFGQEQLVGKTAKIVGIAVAHHRFNYIHPFPDGNGRVSRLMSHAMGHTAGIGAHGLWSISRGLARGLKSRTEYKTMMDLADSPRRGDTDGRGNLSKAALLEFVEWFLKVCVDQVRFMTSLFEVEALAQRLARFVERHLNLKPEAARLLEEALIRGELERGEASRASGLPERSARRALNDLVAAGLLASETPKGAVSLRFPADALDVLFPRLFPEA